MPTMKYDIVLIGGEKDFNMQHLAKRCDQLKLRTLSLLLGSERIPRIHYDLQQDALLVDDQPISTKTAFIRPDVFNYLESKDLLDHKKSDSWFNVFIGWLLAQDNINMFNRRYYHRNSVNKLETLILAKKMGFRIAETYLSNDFNKIADLIDQNNYILKPVDGGSYTQKASIDEIKKLQVKEQNILNLPKIVQGELVAPEIRIFRIGYNLMSFKVTSHHLDYRTDSKTQLDLVKTPPKEIDRFLKLTDRLGLNFAAGDFKTDPKTGSLCLLEVNSGPMFTAFDRACKGLLTEKLLSSLLNL